MEAEIDTCEFWEDMFPAFVDACLWGGPGSEDDIGLAEHLRNCPRCAAQFTVAAELSQWREARAPFDAHVLPLPAQPLRTHFPGGTHRAHPIE